MEGTLPHSASRLPFFKLFFHKRINMYIPTLLGMARSEDPSPRLRPSLTRTSYRSILAPFLLHGELPSLPWCKASPLSCGCSPCRRYRIFPVILLCSSCSLIPFLEKYLAKDNVTVSTGLYGSFTTTTWYNMLLAAKVPNLAQQWANFEYLNLIRVSEKPESV